MTWSKRKKKGCIYPGMPEYDSPTQFSVKLHHGGKFITRGDNTVYTGGDVSWFDYFEDDCVSMLDLQLVVKEAGVLSTNYTLHQRLPRAASLKCRIVSNDIQASEIALFMIKVKFGRYVELFVEHDAVNCVPLDTNVGSSVQQDRVNLNEKISETRYVHVNVENSRACETDEDEVLEKMYDSEYESGEDDMWYDVPISEVVGGSKGNVNGKGKGKAKSVEKKDLVQWSFGSGVKGQENDANYDSDDGLRGYVSDDEEQLNRTMGRIFNPRYDMEKPNFELKMEFADHTTLVDAIKKHSIDEKKHCYFVKEKTKKVTAKCLPPCPWHLYASRCRRETNLVIKTLNTNHTCPINYKNKFLTPAWLAKQHVNDWRSNPKLLAKSFKEAVFGKYSSNISIQQAYRTKKRSFEMIEGSVSEQYSKLWDYAKELTERNPGSSVFIQTDESVQCEDDKKVFQRIYVCLGGLKEGVKCCRKVICLDGCHLKGEKGGQLLTACGIDPNNNWFPFAYAIVEAETKETWNWFIRFMVDDLDIANDSEYMVMSDKQKGLIDAVGHFMPNAEHRFCVMHLLANMRTAGFRGIAYKNQLWEAACATTESRFKVCMDKIYAYNKECGDWFLDKPPIHWSRSQFRTEVKCDILLNNLAESFNSFILEARDKPILACLETIRNQLMSRLDENREISSKKWGSLRLCPKIKKELDKRKKKVNTCIPRSAGGGIYQVTTMTGGQYTVNLRQNTCTCRKWELSGIPCNHAISCMFTRNEEPELYVDECYGVEKYNRVYSFMINPMDHPKMWPQTGLSPLIAPTTSRILPGRPKKLRKRTNEGLTQDQGGEEGEQGTQKLSRKEYLISVKCSMCHVQGHNKRTCPLKETRQSQSQPEVGESNEFAEAFSHTVQENSSNSQSKKKKDYGKKTPAPPGPPPPPPPPPPEKEATTPIITSMATTSNGSKSTLKDAHCFEDIPELLKEMAESLKFDFMNKTAMKKAQPTKGLSPIKLSPIKLSPIRLSPVKVVPTAPKRGPAVAPPISPIEEVSHYPIKPATKPDSSKERKEQTKASNQVPQQKMDRQTSKKAKTTNAKPKFVSRVPKSGRLREKFQFRKIEGVIDLSEEETEEESQETQHDASMSQPVKPCSRMVPAKVYLSQPPPGVMLSANPAVLKNKDSRFNSIEVSGKPYVSVKNADSETGAKPMVIGGKHYVHGKNIKATATSLLAAKGKGKGVME